MILGALPARVSSFLQGFSRDARTPVRIGLTALAATAALGGSASASEPGGSLDGASSGRVVVLGFGGADAEVTRELLGAGELPNLAALAERGGFSALESPPPADPVSSWAALVTGQSAGHSGVFGSMRRELVRGRSVPRAGDIRREWRPTVDYATNPYPTWSQHSFAVGAGLFSLLFLLFVLRILLRMRSLACTGLAVALAIVGSAAGWRARGYLPEAIPRVVGPLAVAPFWDVAEAAGIGGVVLGAPFGTSAGGPNAVEGAAPPVRELAGRGFPDARGERGSWFLYTSDPAEDAPPQGRALGASGIVYPVRERGGVTSSRIYGPVDFAGDERRSSVPLTVERRSDALHVTLGNTSQTLRAGEWSELYPLTFQLNPLLRVNALARARLQVLTERHFELLVEPLHIDPRSPPFWQPPARPIALGSELADGLGEPFETCGFAPLDRDLWGEAALLERAELAWNRRRAQLFHVLATDARLAAAFFDDPGASCELVAADHPGRLDVYRRMDALVGDVMQTLDSADALFVCSDRGGRPPVRVWHLNNWLQENGWLHVRAGTGRGEARVLRFVDWTRSRAFALGSGQLYLHSQGAEPAAAGEREAILDELEAALRGARDPRGGERPVLSVVRRAAEGESSAEFGPFSELGPDLVVGLSPPYAFSSETWAGGLALEEAPSTELDASFADARTGAPGIGTDPSRARGIFFSSLPLVPDAVAQVYDLAPSVLAALGVEPAAHAAGRSRLVR